MEVVKRNYIINGKEYKSLDDIPHELKQFINQDSIKQAETNNTESSQGTIISSASQNSVDLKLMMWVLYIAVQAISLAENQALKTAAIQLKLVDINIYISLAVSFCIGQVSYLLAKRYYSQKKSLNIKYLESFSFFQNLELLQISGIYSLVLNLLFFLILFCIKYIL